MDKTPLYLYTTLGCHLCEHAQALLLPILETSGFSLELVEIADDNQLMEAYGIRIPVIRRSDNDEELGWPFDQAAAMAFLER